MFMYLCMLNHPCISGMKLTLSWWMTFLMHCWILFGSILLRIFVCIFFKDISLSVSFFGCIFLGFWNECNAGFIEWFGSVPSLSIFWKSLRSISVSYLEKFGKIQPWIYQVLGSSSLTILTETKPYACSNKHV
jgi:hypothetical protein